MNHSLKDIPLPTLNEYLENLVDQISKFMRRLKWSLYFKLNPDIKPEQKETYGFKSRNAPPQFNSQNFGEHFAALKAFEDSVYALPRHVKLKHYSCEYQDKLRDTIRRIDECKNVIVAADKTRNFYSVAPESYVKKRNENIQKEYKKVDREKVVKVNESSAQIAKKLDLHDRMQGYRECESFVTVKDHKEEWPEVVKCRLLNPAKSDIGIVSKQILQKINLKLLEKTELNLCRSTNQVLDWYRNLVMKTDDKLNFLVFDIVDYYPSISPKLLDEALNFAKLSCEISEQDIEIIKEARKTFLICEGQPWVKKDSNGEFDVPQGSFDSCEVSEICGIFLLSKISAIVPQKFVILYRDDGLMALRLAPGEMDKLRKDLIKLFKTYGLKITVSISTDVVEYLDIKFNISERSHRAYKKPNDHIVYVHKDSNHPKSVTRNMANQVNKRLNLLSCNEAVFNEDKHVYQDALERSDYTGKLHYIPKDENNNSTVKKKRRRRREVVYCIFPWAANVTPVAKMFLNKLDSHFPKGHPLHRLMNRNTVKVGYSNCRNLKSYISSHNRKILQPHTKEKAGCNCQKRLKDQCPLRGECQTKEIVYEAKITLLATKKVKRYFGITKRPFKNRHQDHKHAFKYRDSKKATALSNYVWWLRDHGKVEGKDYILEWSIKSRAQKYKSGSKRCMHCLKEKTAIALCDPDKLLNNRTELLSKCTHITDLQLQHYL